MKKTTVKIGISGGIMATFFLLGVVMPAAAQVEGTVVALRGEIRVEPPEGSLLSRPAGLAVKGVTVPEALTLLSTSANVSVAFSPSFLPQGLRVDCDCREVSIAAALDQILSITEFGYLELGDQIVIAKRTPQGPMESLRRLPAQWAGANASLPASLSGPLPNNGSRVARAQDGVVTGIVVNARTLAPVEGAQVAVPELGQSTLTDSRGRFRLTELPGQTVTLEVDVLGFRTLTHTVAVGTMDLRLELTEQAMPLDGIIVTGTPGGTQRRALGNSVASVNVSELNELAPGQDLTQLLNARVPGVVFQPGSGAAGAGGRIRIRGTGSLSLRNEPLLYIDGVRVDNSPNRGFGFNEISRFNDIDPAIIESIEVIKGPAAATLYGTEAANGVIQIITKRGSVGAPRVSFSIEQGTNAVTNPESRFRTSYARNAAGEVISLNLVQYETERGTPIFRTGHAQRYGVEVSGGTEGLKYFVNTSFENEEGVVAPNEVHRFRSHLNLDAVVSEKVRVTAGAGYVSSSNEQAHSNLLRGAAMPMPNMLETPFRGHLFGPPEAFREAYTIVEDLSRFTGSFEVRHVPSGWLEQRVRIGIDEVNERGTTLVPRLREEIAIFFGNTALGSSSIAGLQQIGTTIDYSATATTSLSESLNSQTSVGAQYYRSATNTSSITGEVFPAPGVTSISSAARRSASQNSVENVTIGFYVQQQFGWHGRLFLIGAVRADDNSAFGDNFNVVTYPKLSAAWVVSEEPFWNLGLINTFRLRAAYGQSGLQPESFAALRTYTAVVGPNGTAAIAPQGMGNPDLRPERGSEIEVGFEAGMLDDRLAVDFTMYDKRTKDGILAQPTAPSEGFPGIRFVNVGEIQNRGFELGILAMPVMTRNVLWDLGFNISRNENEILDMGALEAATALINQEHRKGYPVAGFWERRVLSAEIGSDGRPQNAMCDGGPDNNHVPVPCAQAPKVYLGQPNPKWEGAITTGLTLFNRLRVASLFDFKLGHRIFNSDIAVACTILRLCEENVFPERNPVAAAEMALFAFGPFNTPEASFGRLRQVSMNYQMPARWATAVGASEAAITFSASNLWLFTNYPGPDPENTRQVGSQHFYSAFQAAPHPLQFRTAVRITY